jgi:hypothetical protein
MSVGIGVRPLATEDGFRMIDMPGAPPAAHFPPGHRLLLAEWVARVTTPDDVVITHHDLIVYLYIERRAVPTATFTARGRITSLTPAEDAAILREMLSSTVVHRERAAVDCVRCTPGGGTASASAMCRQH